MRDPSSAYVDGWPYATVFDRLLAPVRGFVAKQVTAEHQVIDLCCGTGALVSLLAPRCQRVVGVDLSPRMIRHAKRTVEQRVRGNVHFEISDAAELHHVNDRTFDLATLILGLHEMPAQHRRGVLSEALRVARRTLVIDYAVPLPWNWVGLLSGVSEIACGPRHLASFVDYVRRDGLEPLLRDTDGHIVRRGKLSLGCFEAVTLVGPDAQ